MPPWSNNAEIHGRTSSFTVSWLRTRMGYRHFEKELPTPQRKCPSLPVPVTYDGTLVGGPQQPPILPSSRSVAVYMIHRPGRTCCLTVLQLRPKIRNADVVCVISWGHLCKSSQGPFFHLISGIFSKSCCTF